MTGPDAAATLDDCVAGSRPFHMTGTVTNKSAETFAIDVTNVVTVTPTDGTLAYLEQDSAGKPRIRYEGGDFSTHVLLDFLYIDVTTSGAGTYAIKDVGADSGAMLDQLTAGDSALTGLSHPYRGSETQYEVGEAQSGSVNVVSYDPASCGLVHLTLNASLPQSSHVTACVLVPVGSSNCNCDGVCNSPQEDSATCPHDCP